MEKTGAGIIGELLFTFSTRLMSSSFAVSYPGIQSLIRYIQYFVLCGTKLCPFLF